MVLGLDYWRLEYKVELFTDFRVKIKIKLRGLDFSGN